MPVKNKTDMLDYEIKNVIFRDDVTGYLVTLYHDDIIKSGTILGSGDLQMLSNTQWDCRELEIESIKWMYENGRLSRRI